MVVSRLQQRLKIIPFSDQIAYKNIKLSVIKESYYVSRVLILFKFHLVRINRYHANVILHDFLVKVAQYSLKKYGKFTI